MMPLRYALRSSFHDVDPDDAGEEKSNRSLFAALPGKLQPILGRKLPLWQVEAGVLSLMALVMLGVLYCVLKKPAPAATYTLPPQHSDMAQRTAVQVAVLGGGVVGCADSLEHRCLSRALPRNVPTYRALGVPHRETGALYVAWTDEEAEALETLERSTEEVDLQRLSPEERDSIRFVASRFELKDMEPALSPSLGGVLVPGEVTVDPGLVVLAFAAEAHSLGAQIREHCEVSFAGRYGEAWLLQLPDETLLAEQVVSCTGLSAALWDFSELWFQPRRGDYLLFQRPSPHSLAPLGRPIGAVPTPHARGVYVWPTVHGDVLCGPTNVPQADQLLPKPSDATLDALRRKAISVCPALAGWPVAGSYAGLRPALADTFGTDYLLMLGELLEELDLHLGRAQHWAHSLSGDCARSAGKVDQCSRRAPP
eukprot:g11707.t1